MSVRVDRCHDAFVASSMPVTPIHFEPPWITIEFDDGSCTGSAVDDFINVKLVAFSLEKESSREVSNHGDVGVFHGTNDSGGHLFFR